MVTLRPLHDRILVSPIEATTTTAGGIIIPEAAKEKPQEAKVIAVGAGKILEDGTRREIDLKEGDHILYGKYSGVTAKLGEEEVLLLREDEVLAVVEKT